MTAILYQPIAVDLDGTLIREESTSFLFKRLLSKHPLKAFYGITLLMTRGRVAFKELIANSLDVFPRSWTWNEPLLSHLKNLKSKGHPLILVTGAPQDFAKATAAPQGLFDQIWGSSQSCNFVGAAKSQKLCHHFGKGRFIYVGNSLQDYAVWQNAQEAWVVAPSLCVRLLLKRLQIPVRIFP